MARALRNIIGAIALVVVSQTAAAALDGGVAIPAGASAERNAPRPDDAHYLLAQAAAPAVPAATPAQDSHAPQDQSSAAAASPSSPPSTAEVTRGEKTVPGCALKYMAAELAGKLKGRKWKEFRQEECGASTVLVVFPSAIAPKYSTQTPDKARMLTCADQFSANKASNGNGGLKWIEKSGGYYSECAVRLKG
jgi:hypothetical protein